MIKRLTCAALFGGLANVPAATAQMVQLPSDAEYQGAMLKGSAVQRVNFYPNGRVQSGYLKSDYERGGMVFAAESLVKFFPDGSVSEGQLKSGLEYADIAFEPGPVTFWPGGAVRSGRVKAGTRIQNLGIPVASFIQLNGAGRVLGVNPEASPLAMRVLDRTIRGDFTVQYDAVTGRYALTGGVAGVPQLVARMATKWGTSGDPTEVIPVIMPAGTSFQIALAGPGEADRPPEALWVLTPPQPFIFNGINFGANARVHVRDMRITRIQVSQTITINGFQYRALQMVVFDDAGRIAPPEIEPS